MKHQLLDLATAVGVLFALAKDDHYLRHAAMHAEQAVHDLAEYDYEDTADEEEVPTGGDPNADPEDE